MVPVTDQAEKKRGVSPLAVIAGLIVVAILAAAGWIGWVYWGANMLADGAAETTVSELRADWAASPAVPDPDADPEAPPVAEQPVMGEPAWVLSIPAINLEWPIIAGVDEEELAKGVGWYPTTALPGQAGNVALAGHRTTDGAPFRDLLNLEVGDAVIIDTREATFTYTVNSAPGSLTVQGDESWVLDPVPGQSDVVPTQAIVTLTTSEDLIPTADRAVGFATLTKTEKK